MDPGVASPQPPPAPAASALIQVNALQDVTRRGRSGHATLLGGAQADAAAAGATEVMRSLLDGEVAEPGAWMPEQVIDPASFFSRLAGRRRVVVQHVNAGLAAHQARRPPAS